VIRHFQPRLIIEVGSGFSSLVLGQAVKEQERGPNLYRTIPARVPLRGISGVAIHNASRLRSNSPLPRRTWPRFIGHRLSLFECAATEAIVAAPIDGNHYYSFSRLWHYGKREAAQLVANGLARAIPVYALLLPSKDVDQDIKRLPLIQGYTWKRSKQSNVRVVIMTLTKDAPPLTFNLAFCLTRDT
jgi:hypothetical protein